MGERTITNSSVVRPESRSVPGVCSTAKAEARWCCSSTL